MKFALVADHPGPRATLRALAASCPGEAVWVDERVGGVDPGGFDALVRGTSEATGPDSLERTWSRRFAAADRPVFAVEDFPLNFPAGETLLPDVLFVEFDEVSRRHADRGLTAERILVSGTPRYTVAQPAKPPPASGGTILWAGQPDQAASFDTLTALLPILRAVRARLFFRAHPRDGYYREGRYASLLAGLGERARDVTADPSLDALAPHIDLVVTQYSTVALELAAHGIPALFVLLPRLHSMQRFKGHDWLPWTERGAAFSVREIAQLEAVFRRALYDKIARSEVLDRFRPIAGFNAGAANRIWSRISSLCSVRPERQTPNNPRRI